jgi:transglutaminase-like putative cysteine protease
MPLVFASTDLRHYLVSDGVVEADNSEVVALAEQICAGASSDIERCRRLFEWVRDEVPHSKDINSDLVTCTANEVLREKTGICYAKSHLLAALCRTMQIPTGFCYQVYRIDPALPPTAVHGFTAHYLASQGRWVRLDARGNTGEIRAEFSLEEEKLAFPVNPALGELYIYETVFDSPVPEVVAALRAFQSRRLLWEHLPAIVPDEYLCSHTDREFNASLLKEARGPS